MDKIHVKPGHIVATDMGAYQHYSLVTDQKCDKGNWKLISATKRNGTVKEETWDSVVTGRTTYLADYVLTRPLSEVLADARSQIDKWDYEVLNRNCEHFVKWSTGMEISSSQVKAGGGGVLVGLGLVALLSEEPKALKFLTGAFLCAGIAVAAVSIANPSKQVFPASQHR